MIEGVATAGAWVVIAAHVLFIVFNVFGAWLGVWNRWFLAVHAPVFLYSVMIESMGFNCPLTDLEKWLWVLAGQEAYGPGFVAYYITPTVRSLGLPGWLYNNLGVAILATNAGAYLTVGIVAGLGWMARRKQKAELARITDCKEK